MRDFAREASGHYFAGLTHVGALLGTYLLCEGAGELVVIDQHAAHERVAYERLRAAYGAKKVASQRLLLPSTVALTAAERELLSAHAELFADFGFELVVSAQLEVRAVPEVIASRAPESLVRELTLGLGAENVTSHERAVEHMLATIACHSVANETREPHALLQALDEFARSTYQPHGRPLFVRVTSHELETALRSRMIAIVGPTASGKIARGARARGARRRGNRRVRFDAGLSPLRHRQPRSPRAKSAQRFRTTSSTSSSPT